MCFQGIAGADGLPGDKGELVSVLKFSRIEFEVIEQRTEL